jgi:CMP-N-acetylneuraminic acid synthetase
MKVLAIIPARKGSKRLPGKNGKLLGGVPMITWAINSVKEISEISDILISTDDPEIIEIANHHKVLAPWLRPEHLCDDEASSIDVTLHALEWYQRSVQEVDGVMLVQPTSPFRTRRSIVTAINEFKFCESIVSVSPVNLNPGWSYRLESNLLVEPQENLTNIYALNGLVYLCTPNFLINNQSFVTKDTRGLIINSKKESLDIDTQEDFDLAEFYIHRDT